MKWRGGRSRVSRDRHKHLLCHIQARVNVGSFVAASSRGRPVQSEWRLRAVDSMGQGLTKQGPRRMGNPFIPPAVSQGQTELRTSDRDYSQSPSSGVIDAAAGSTGGIPGLGGASGSVARCTRPPTFGGSAHPTSVPRQARLPRLAASTRWQCRREDLRATVGKPRSPKARLASESLTKVSRWLQLPAGMSRLTHLVARATEGAQR